MAVAHTTVLSYLGKHISFETSVPLDYDQSIFVHRSGKVISVLIELDGDHKLCVDYGNDNAHFFSLTDMKINS